MVAIVLNNKVLSSSVVEQRGDRCGSHKSLACCTKTRSYVLLLICSNNNHDKVLSKWYLTNVLKSCLTKIYRFKLGARLYLVLSYYRQLIFFYLIPRVKIWMFNIKNSLFFLFNIK